MNEVYAIVDPNNIIVNVTVYDGVSEYDCEPNRLVKFSDLPSDLTIGDSID